MQFLDAIANKVPPQAWFGVSAVFHYLGPSFAVLLFPSVGVLGVAWLRIASAAFVFALFANPLKVIAKADARGRMLLVGLGLTLAAMNVCFYLALARLPMSLVAATEFLCTLAIALYGLRTPRNAAALGLAAAGVAVLLDVEWSSDWPGLCFAVLNAILFGVYIVLGHAIAGSGASRGVETLGAAMLVALVVSFPVGFAQAAEAFGSLHLLIASIGVGICSSVIPYVSDQFAMSRLPRASFALMLALLPATAAVIAALVLAQIPSMSDLAGIGLVMLGVALHRPRADIVTAPRTAPSS